MESDLYDAGDATAQRRKCARGGTLTIKSPTHASDQLLDGGLRLITERDALKAQVARLLDIIDRVRDEAAVAYQAGDLSYLLVLQHGELADALEAERE